MTIPLKKYRAEIKFLEQVKKKAIQRKIPVIDDNSAQFLETICFLKKPSKILEIGCGTGYSTYFLWKGIILSQTIFSYTGIDLNTARIKEAQEFLLKSFPDCRESMGKNLVFLQGNALELVPFLNLKFELVVIDGAKFEYARYLEALEGKLDNGCIIVADNIFLSGKIWGKKFSPHDYNSAIGMKDYLKKISNKKIFETVFFNIGDGLSLSIFRDFAKKNER